MTIAEFADKWITVFRKENFNPYEVIEDHSFSIECYSFGFEMDCGHRFEKTFPGCFSNTDLLEQNLAKMNDADLMGSAIHSRWRYYNHLAYSSSELADPESKKWFILALTKLKELDYQVIKFKKDDPVYGCFSNYYPCVIGYEGLVYHSSEAVWQSLKTLDENVRVKFTGVSPDGAKKLGKSVDLRADWEKVKYQLMVNVCLAKFAQHEELRKTLIGTGSARIVEDTTGWHDNIWGTCTCEKCFGRGENLLGKALMTVRAMLSVVDQVRP